MVTTRYSVPDLRAYWQTTAPEVKLTRLSNEAGVELLRSLGVRGTQQEFETLVEDMKGHALTLNLLGTYLRDAHTGDIRKRDLVKLKEADAEEQGGHAFRVMDAYVRWFQGEGEKGHRALAVLRCLGLFDRPATADCLAALQQAPAISGMTKALGGISEAQRNLTYTRLEAAKLLTVNRDAAGKLLSLDAHPLLREYFAVERHTQHPDAWRAAHRRLYEHLCATTPDKPRPTLEDLQPLYQAVAHGCQAGLQQEACDKVFFERIKRGNEHYTTNKLGAVASDLGAQACFFERVWSCASGSLSEVSQALVLSDAAFSLWALGRLTEALEPMRAAYEGYVRLRQWTRSAILASNLSELELTLGEVAGAVGDAEKSVTYADRSGDAPQRMINRMRRADALHQSGHQAEAETRFREAEQLLAERVPAYPLLYSWQGFAYCDLLLAASERAAWRVICSGGLRAPSEIGAQRATLQNARAKAAPEIALNVSRNLLDIALDHLTLGRAALYDAILTKSEVGSAKSDIEQAVTGFRRAGMQDYVPRGLLTRAWLHFLEGHRTGPESAQADLDEAWEIAERGPMKLHMADIHLHRARLFFREPEYPWGSPAADLAAARELVEKCGYGRRKEELADAEAAVQKRAQG